MGSRVCVVGAGSWGTTIALLSAPGGPTTLWARSAERASEIDGVRANERYLPGIALPADLTVTSDLAVAVAGADVVALGVPSSAMRETMRAVAAHLAPCAVLVSLAKGLEVGGMRRMSEVIGELAPDHPVAVLSGPNLAREIAAGHPAASVVACADESVARAAADRLSRPVFRLYTNPDVVGCEIAGVVKNVIAIAAGIAQGFGFGDNTKAALITRGLAEMTRLGRALGADPATFAGLAGMGDLIATCASMQSRNTQVGVRLGRGETIDDIVGSMNQVAEGVRSAAAVVALARRHDVEMPIAEQVAAVCEGRRPAATSLAELMSRSAGSERV